ncbi:NAD(P)-binding protein [Favolaschia claudopus]|uniref:NAD(P)-binding protein n=1 Tax=Favolaschia claudopus TaxID=2862362 RepID=A0AAW0EHT0_9AGAR
MPSYVVTGASRGIGLQFVKHLSANDENQVFAIVRNKSTAKFLHELCESRGNVTILEADVTDAKALNLAAAEVAKATDNKLDYLINNAGSSTLPGFTIDQLSARQCKLNSVVHSTNAFLPLLKNGSTKKVLTLSSGVGHLGFTLQSGMAGSVSYAIAKAALNMAVAKFAVQYKAEGFVFLSINPGSVDTSATQVAPWPAGGVKEIEMLMAGLSNIMPTIPPPISTEESVRMQLEVFYNWPIERSGEMVSHFGNDTRWL